jgi:hypothetical protein
MSAADVSPPFPGKSPAGEGGAFQWRSEAARHLTGKGDLWEESRWGMVPSHLQRPRRRMVALPTEKDPVAMGWLEHRPGPTSADRYFLLTHVLGRSDMLWHAPGPPGPQGFPQSRQAHRPSSAQPQQRAADRNTGLPSTVPSWVAG